MRLFGWFRADPAKQRAFELALAERCRSKVVVQQASARMDLTLEKLGVNIDRALADLAGPTLHISSHDHRR